MQRCFVLHLCKQLAPGNVSFPQFFLLAYLDRKEVLSMSEIAKKMGHLIMMEQPELLAQELRAAFRSLR